MVLSPVTCINWERIFENVKISDFKDNVIYSEKSLCGLWLLITSVLFLHTHKFSSYREKKSESSQNTPECTCYGNRFLRKKNWDLFRWVFLFHLITKNYLLSFENREHQQNRLWKHALFLLYFGEFIPYSTLLENFLWRHT